MKSITRQIKELRAMKVSGLVIKYKKVFGKEPRVKHREWLWKRISWRIQEQRFGGLTVAAQRHLEALIADIDLPIDENQRVVTGKLRGPRAPGDPAVGTSLIRKWRGNEYHVKVLDEGFEYDGVMYRSLSAVAKAVTGSHWNGKLFFGITQRRIRK